MAGGLALVGSRGNGGEGLERSCPANSLGEVGGDSGCGGNVRV